MQTLDIALPPSTAGLISTTIVCTVSSDGKIYLYDMANVPEHAGATKIVELNPIEEYDSKGTRLTCVTLADGEAVGPPVNRKRKQGEEGPASEDEGSSSSAWKDGDTAGDDESEEDDNEEEEEAEEEEGEEDSAEDSD